MKAVDNYYVYDMMVRDKLQVNITQLTMFFASPLTNKKGDFGGIPYTAHGAQITYTPPFFIFVFMFILG